MRAQAAAPLGRQVVERGPARGQALAVLGAILVDRSRRDLLGRLLALAAIEKAFLDVLVLALALGAPSTCGIAFSRSLWSRWPAIGMPAGGARPD